MKIIITGDLVITEEYETSKIHQDISNLFKESDLNIINLEAPVTNSISKILKTGPHLKSNRTGTLNVLKELEIDVVALANNHILDLNEKGVMDTLSFCKINNVKTVGAGISLYEASRTLFIETEVGTIAIINISENEWSNATEFSAGANPMDLIDNANQIKAARKRAEFVFVIIHGGHEYYNLPSPRMQKQYRYYAEQGADIIVGHHSHCLSGNEIYNEVPIFYGLGNFLFTKQNIHKDWYLGLILEIEINEAKLTTQLHPLKQQQKTFELCLLQKEERKLINNRIANYNSIISDHKKLQTEWHNYIEAKYELYLSMWSPLSFIKNKYLTALLRRLPKKYINKKGLALYLNLMRCEAHREMSIEVIGKYLKR